MEIIVQITIALIGIGTFVGTTQNALRSMEKRLDKLDALGVQCVERLSRVEAKITPSE